MATGRPTFHHLNHSQSQKILWLIEELGFDYDLKLYERVKSGPNEGRSPEELKQVGGFGKAPTFVTAEGRVIIESGAIGRYLIKKYDTKHQFQGDEATGNDEVRNDMLVGFADSLGLVMIVEQLFELVALRSPFFIRFITNGIRQAIRKAFTAAELEKSFIYLEKELGEQDYFMGSSPGLADFMLSWPFDFCTQRKYVDLAKYPALKRYHDRVQAREGWKRSRSKGNDYNLAQGLG